MEKPAGFEADAPTPQSTQNRYQACGGAQVRASQENSPGDFQVLLLWAEWQGCGEEEAEGAALKYQPSKAEHVDRRTQHRFALA